MSYVALATDSFEAVTLFYERLGFVVTSEWDRPTGRGKRFNLVGLTLEILDNGRERQPLMLSPVADRVHLVLEIDDIVVEHARIAVEDVPGPIIAASWGADLFQVRDPDGVLVTFLSRDDQQELQG